MIKWNRFDTDCKMNELFSPAELASQLGGGGGGGGDGQWMDGWTRCASLAREVVPRNLIFV